MRPYLAYCTFCSFNEFNSILIAHTYSKIDTRLYFSRILLLFLNMSMNVPPSPQRGDKGSTYIIPPLRGG